jgi:hypothetical protein
MSTPIAEMNKVNAHFRNQFPGKRICAEGRYCMDCDHFRIGSQPSRGCARFPRKFLFAPGYHYADELRENGKVQAEVCKAFKWAAEVEVTDG